MLKLPGVGPGTAGALLAYAFSQPTVFIETNIRTVYFEHFFAGDQTVADTQLYPLVERTLDVEHPREFYWALMDYGTWLKRRGQGRLHKSAHYKRQAPFQGSNRQLRGNIVRLLAGGALKKSDLKRKNGSDERFEAALAGLIADGLVGQTGAVIHLTK